MKEKTAVLIIIEQNTVNEVKIQLSYIVSCILSTHYASEVNIVITMSWTSVKSHYMITGTTYCFNAIFLIPKEKANYCSSPLPVDAGIYASHSIAPRPTSTAAARLPASTVSPEAAFLEDSEVEEEKEPVLVEVPVASALEPSTLLVT